MTADAFDLARRGYDREQVDGRLRQLGDQLAAAEEARRREAERASLLEAQLAARSSSLARSATKQASETTPEGWGARAEKVLRLAEELAEELRTQSAQEAAAVVERARADAESHWQEVEQTLVARAARQDQEATRRRAELQERAEQVTVQLAAAREKADEIRAVAQREAEQAREEARQHAGDLRRRAEEEIRAQREDADGELLRVRTLRDDVRAEILRLHQLLGKEIAAEPEHAAHDDGGDGDDGDDGDDSDDRAFEGAGTEESTPDGPAFGESAFDESTPDGPASDDSAFDESAFDDTVPDEPPGELAAEKTVEDGDHADNGGAPGPGDGQGWRYRPSPHPGRVALAPRFGAGVVVEPPPDDAPWSPRVR